MNRRLSSLAPARLRCAAVLASILVASCAGDEFQGAGSGGAASTNAASTGVGSTGTPSTSASVTTGDSSTTGEGGSPVSSSTGEGASSGEGGGSGGASGSGGSPGSGGGGGSEPTGDCDPEVSGDLPVPGDCGVFVDPTLDENVVGSGTRSDPFRSLTDGLAAVAGRDERRIYVQAGVVEEAVTVSVEGVAIHGGLTHDWTFDGGARTQISRPADSSAVAAVVVRPAGQQISISDFIISDPTRTIAGTSAIALLVEGADVLLRRVNLEAGNGADGANGETPTDDIGSTDAEGDLTLRGALTTTINGGEGASNPRPGCSSVGGDGGDGAPIAPTFEAGSGTNGVPGSAQGGDGATYDGETHVPCEAGGDGGYTYPGSSGDGALGPGAIDPDLGYVGPTPTPAERGSPGRAGGGGGGGRSYFEIQTGQGGDGGSAGGCGGFGGGGGQSGGGSFALVALNADINVSSDVVLNAGDGGDGGNGAQGQFGAVGGPRTPDGTYVTHGCRGGSGGRGGEGGWGGGGAGGPSVGMGVFQSTILGSPLIVTGDPGAGGASSPEIFDADDGFAEGTFVFDLAEN